MTTMIISVALASVPLGKVSMGNHIMTSINSYITDTSLHVTLDTTGHDLRALYSKLDEDARDKFDNQVIIASIEYKLLVSDVEGYLSGARYSQREAQSSASHLTTSIGIFVALSVFLMALFYHKTVPDIVDTKVLDSIISVIGKMLN